MHELSIMQSALNMALQKTREAQATRVHVIRLRVGQFSGVVPDSLQFAFEALTPGTPAEGAQLAIEHVPARFWCAQCQRDFVVEDYLPECPDCHSPSSDMRAGRELEIASLEIE